MYVYVYGMATTKHELLPHKYHSNYTICDTNIDRMVDCCRNDWYS